jgi:hypothetical protein
MKRIDTSIVLGLLLTGLGVVFLLQTVLGLAFVWNIVWALLFGAAGVGFLLAFLGDRERWWALIPGFALLGIAVLIAFGDFLGEWGGTLFLGALSLAFWAVYLMRREYWWAVVPGGVLLTLAVIPAISDVLDGLAVAGVLFLGMALTFGLVYFLPPEARRRRWALIPAAALLVMGLVFGVFGIPGLNSFWPVLLMLGGIYVVARSLGWGRR